VLDYPKVLGPWAFHSSHNSAGPTYDRSQPTSCSPHNLVDSQGSCTPLLPREAMLNSSA
jgi:hypothetical protein